MKHAALLLLALPLTSCADFRTRFDELTFTHFGGTLFSSPTTVSLKEVHLDSGALLGRDVVVEGDLVTQGEFGTHIVISDKQARMLVVLSQVPKAGEVIASAKDRHLRIIGTVERGKKGLPFVMARVVANTGG